MLVQSDILIYIVAKMLSGHQASWSKQYRAEQKNAWVYHSVPASIILQCNKGLLVAKNECHVLEPRKCAFHDWVHRVHTFHADHVGSKLPFPLRGDVVERPSMPLATFRTLDWIQRSSRSSREEGAQYGPVAHFVYLRIMDFLKLFSLSHHTAATW